MQLVKQKNQTLSKKPNVTNAKKQKSLSQMDNMVCVPIHKQYKINPKPIRSKQNQCETNIKSIFKLQRHYKKNGKSKLTKIEKNSTPLRNHCDTYAKT